MPSSDPELSVTDTSTGLVLLGADIPTKSIDTPLRLKQTELCYKCARWDWQQICSRLSQRRDNEQTYLDASDLGDASHWSSPLTGSLQHACPLCAWMSSLVTPERRWSYQVTFANHIIYGSSKRTRKGAPVLVPDTGKSTAHSMIVIQHPQSLRERFAPRIINPHSIEYSVLRMWLRRCTDKHSVACLPRTEELPSNFKLIHCLTKSVSKVAKKVPYLALSYVWGQASSDTLEDSLLPQTIEDAITVTLKLGFDYLWVDRYCINQTNHDEKHDQILNMGTIYASAALVIIAAAGDNPSYGLPGVSTRARRKQRSIEIGHHALIEAYPNLSAQVTESTWTKRAWTYQEGHLARRRLIFTDQQVSYVCDYGYCVETLRSTIRSADCLPLYSMGQTFATSYEQHEPWYYHRCLTEYTKRHLSYDSDSLNAFLGVLGTWAPSDRSHGQEGFIHFWGLKLTRDWLALDWYHETPGQKRVGFPSWTWASTNGTIEYYGLTRNFGAEHMEVAFEPSFTEAPFYSSDIEVTVYRPLSEFLTYLNGKSADLRWAPRRLRITGICPHFQLRGARSDAVWRAQIELPREVLDCAIFRDHPINWADMMNCIALLVNDILLLLRPVKDRDIFERVGLMVPKPTYRQHYRGWDWPAKPRRTVVIA